MNVLYSSVTYNRNSLQRKYELRVSHLDVNIVPKQQHIHCNATRKKHESCSVESQDHAAINRLLMSVFRPQQYGSG